MFMRSLLWLEAAVVSTYYHLIPNKIVNNLCYRHTHLMTKLSRLNLKGSKGKLHLPNGMIAIYFQRLIIISS